MEIYEVKVLFSIYSSSENLYTLLTEYYKTNEKNLCVNALQIKKMTIVLMS